MIQVVRGPLEICRGGGAKVSVGLRWAGRRGVRQFSPAALENPRQMLSQALRNGPGRRSAPSPFPAPRKRIGGLGGRGSGGQLAAIQAVGPEKRPSHSGDSVEAKVSIQVFGGELVLPTSRKKNPGRHGLGGFHDGTLGAWPVWMSRKTSTKDCGRRWPQSALLMTNTAALSVVSVREPPAHTSTLQRNRAVAAIKRTILRIIPSMSDEQDSPSSSGHLWRRSHPGVLPPLPPRAAG